MSIAPPPLACCLPDPTAFACLNPAGQRDWLTLLCLCVPGSTTLVCADDRCQIYARYFEAQRFGSPGFTLEECQRLGSCLAWYWSWDQNMAPDPLRLGCNAPRVTKALLAYARYRGHIGVTMDRGRQPAHRTLLHCTLIIPPRYRPWERELALTHDEIDAVSVYVRRYNEWTHVTPSPLQTKQPMVLKLRRDTPCVGACVAQGRGTTTLCHGGTCRFDREAVSTAVQREIESRGVHHVAQVWRTEYTCGASLFELVIVRAITHADTLHSCKRFKLPRGPCMTSTRPHTGEYRASSALSTQKTAKANTRQPADAMDTEDEELAEAASALLAVAQHGRASMPITDATLRYPIQ